ncbi:hypothetical protein [Treponema endosymbiont of Eucomonympha sp.]|nr:hypothetical protein [Treponema endosymbiont of Eucomonympha sp.]
MFEFLEGTAASLRLATEFSSQTRGVEALPMGEGIQGGTKTPARA